MPLAWKFVARAVGTAGVVLGLASSAWAVAAVGTPKRVDVDPGAVAAPVYGLGVFYVVRTATGGFATAWEENTRSESPNPVIWERIRYRVYGNTFAAVGTPRAADLSGAKRLPGLSGIVPLGTDKAYLIYGLTRDNAHVDHPVIREAFGQRIALTTGAPIGTRQLLNPVATGFWDNNIFGIPAGLPDGRAVFAWYETDDVAPVPGRFISSAGALQPATLDFECCGSIREAQLVWLQPLGSGFLADYVRNSVFGNSGIYARVFKADGQPLAAAKYFAIDSFSPIPKALSNGRIVVFRYVLISSNPNRYKLMAQLYTSGWVKIGAEKTLIADTTTTKYVDFTPSLDGGLFMIRTLFNGSVYSRSVRRLNANLVPVLPDYTFAAPHFDGFRIAALSNNRAVVLFRNIVGDRHRLFAQIVSY